jgi:hypothetical protein
MPPVFPRRKLLFRIYRGAPKVTHPKLSLLPFSQFRMRMPATAQKGFERSGPVVRGLFAFVRSLPRSMPFPKKRSPGHDKVIILVVRTLQLQLQRSEYSLRIHISFQNSFPTRVQYSSPCPQDLCEADDERRGCGDAPVLYSLILRRCLV